MALPATRLLDDFSRPNENPLSWNGAWLPMDTGAFPNNLAITSRVLSSILGGSYWTQLPGLIESEAWCRIGTGGNTRYLLLRGKDLGGSNTFDGYLAAFGPTTIVIFRMTDGGFFSLGSTAGSQTTGDVMVFRAVGPTLTVYQIDGGTATPRQIVSRSDTTYTSGFIGVASANANITGFGGGNLNDPLVPSAHPAYGYGAV